MHHQERTEEEIRRNEQIAYKLMQEGKYINDEDIKNLENLMQTSRDITKELEESGVEDEEKAKDIFNKIKDNNNSFTDALSAVLYSIPLYRKEFKFMESVIVNRNEYNRENGKVAMLVNEDFVKPTRELFKDKSVDDIMLSINITNLTRLSHVLSLYNVKGINDELYLSDIILEKIIEVMSIFYYYQDKIGAINEGYNRVATKLHEERLAKEAQQPKDVEVEVEEEKVLVDKKIQPKTKEEKSE